MIPKRLKPSMDLLCEEYVLVQAWKKTAPYIRYHNWYSDTLSLDRTSINLPKFIDEIRERLQSSEEWKNEYLRIVLAPKSQNWKIKNNVWRPAKSKSNSSRLRPLAHVSLADQVVATAAMLCLADRVETKQKDPRENESVWSPKYRVISYGNRLFCDNFDGKLYHRWGSSKLYRAYYQDYRSFLSRPQRIANSIPNEEIHYAYVVHADLKQFYDRVSPELLHSTIKEFSRHDDDPAFFRFTETLFNWRWKPQDRMNEVQNYEMQSDLDDFSRIALPQGLVASGFFANVVLHAFDDALRSAIGTEISSGIEVKDACRYVDDMRILIVSKTNDSLKEIQKTVSDWLGKILTRKSNNHLLLSPDKTQIAKLQGDERPLVRQSARMHSIQSAVSGGFDALGGEKILDSIQDLMRAQEALTISYDSEWQLSPIADVRDSTVARFSAARYRITFRSIRPLLPEDNASVQDRVADFSTVPIGRNYKLRKRYELDNDARAFALSLIKQWIDDPSNVRLLRIGFDIWPDVRHLKKILFLLRPFTEKGGPRKGPRRVAWYCLAEILRAGATETGIVEDAESLPSDICLRSYRDELRREATRLISLSSTTIPWYLRQQALLYLATCQPSEELSTRLGSGSETRHYRELIEFQIGEARNLSDSNFATLAVLTRRAFEGRERSCELTRPRLDNSLKLHLAQKDPTFLLELFESEPDARFFFDDLPNFIRRDLCKGLDNFDNGYDSLANVVLDKHPNSYLRNELSLLRFALKFLEELQKSETTPKLITPSQVGLKFGEDPIVADIEDLKIIQIENENSESLYAAPKWCQNSECWRFQLGFLLRFILSGQPDFTRPVRKSSWRETETCYRAAESHWYQRLYGLYSGQPAFGDDWLPITEWLEGFLLFLLHWPGCRIPSEFNWMNESIDSVKDQIKLRIEKLEIRRGAATRQLILPLRINLPSLSIQRFLRACVVQTAIPTTDDFNRTDLELKNPSIRRKHRNHLSAALAAVESTLALRATHKAPGKQLDWLILPELAVHPKDIDTHLIPFARAHRTIILAGITYEELIQGNPLVNSALWIIPEWSKSFGLQIKKYRQGKANLAPEEQNFNQQGNKALLEGFRPSQWLIGFPWPNMDDPVWLTASVCYDATDLKLVADLRDQSDIFAIPALNKDIKTFDQMGLALHYHMFQLVVIANNGQYGGSNAYWPHSDPHKRQLFHVHGQPQTSITFFEIEKTVAESLKRCNLKAKVSDEWKHPPAGFRLDNS